MYGRGFGLLVFAILLVALIAECIAAKGGFSGVRRIVVLLILTSSAVFATAQFRYASVDENRDSYMQYMTDEKSVIVWGKIYKTEYKYFVFLTLRVVSLNPVPSCRASSADPSSD